MNAGMGQSQAPRKLMLLLAVMAGFLIMAFSSSRFRYAELMQEFIDWYGLLLIIICIFGRSWTILYIGGRKSSELVMEGPYSVCRNPLYLFSILGAVGTGMQSGSVFLGLMFGLVVAIVFFFTIRQEEQWLLGRHGEKYAAYLQSVPRFIPKMALWKDADILSLNRKTLARTFLDASIFLLSIPLAETLVFLQKQGYLPVLIVFPW